jgi:hypothetical protein
MGAGNSRTSCCRRCIEPWLIERLFGYGRDMALPARSLDPDARDRLAALTPRVVPSALARERVIPVHPALESILPEGVPRGSVVVCDGPMALSTALLLAAEATRQGTWLGVAGLPELGVAAAGEIGVALERMVLVRDIETVGDEQCGHALAALIDGFDLVMLGSAARIRTGTARRLHARLRARGAVMVVVGAPGAFPGDLRVAARSTWFGLGHGHGSLRSRRVEVTVDGRRIPRPRRLDVWVPDPSGEIAAAPTVATLPVAPMRAAPMPVDEMPVDQMVSGARAG